MHLWRETKKQKTETHMLSERGRDRDCFHMFVNLRNNAHRDRLSLRIRKACMWGGGEGGKERGIILQNQKAGEVGWNVSHNQKGVG